MLNPIPNEAGTPYSMGEQEDLLSKIGLSLEIITLPKEKKLNSSLGLCSYIILSIRRGKLPPNIPIISWGQTSKKIPTYLVSKESKFLRHLRDSERYKV